MAAPEGASQAAQARIAEEMSKMQARGAAAAAAAATGEREVHVDDVRKEGSKDVQKVRQSQFRSRHALLVTLFGLILVFHVVGIYLFLSGFLLTRLVLPYQSECANPPVTPLSHVPGSSTNGCWHPKSFEKAIVIIVDALRYDFTVPFTPKELGDIPHHFHNSLPILWDTAISQPENAFLLPFIADPPTTTLQRLKGLTTGTLPTFIDAGSNFAGTAIDEDNLVAQLHSAGKKIVQLGDDTWQSLFPGLFDEELTRPFDSFNVWDLYTVDNGVNEHLFPLLDRNNVSRWDVIFGHYLGVDHAGHRYGPDHPAMAAKLEEMNDVLKRIMEAISDDTLLVVMGDHGMDAKGDHGGESDDEVEAALWMYSKAGLFGRSSAAGVQPPRTAKERPVEQIDLVPTLSLLLGMPVPFNNLGQPIKEAFLGKSGDNYRNLAEVSRLTAAQIHRYHGEYAAVRKLDAATNAAAASFWDSANMAWDIISTATKSNPGLWKGPAHQFSSYQQENLRVCRSLWARFDLVSMGMGIAVLVGALLLLAFLAGGFDGDRAEHAYTVVTRGGAGVGAGAVVGVALWFVAPATVATTLAVSAPGVVGLLGAFSAFLTSFSSLRVPLPRSFWGWVCFIPPVLLCIGFASNSFTIWEDEILLYMLTTIGALMAASSLRQADAHDRFLGISNSISLVVLTRVASFSRLCREEQMPYCVSTYYSSATSSTSAKWQLSIPFIVALLLPSAIRDFYARTKNYQGSAIVWIGFAFRVGLVLSASYWLLDAADDGSWFPTLDPTTLKSTRVIIAQVVLALAWAAGYGTYIWASPFLGVEEEEAVVKPESEVLDPSDPTSDIFTPMTPQVNKRKKLIILGYANTHGTRYALLPTIWALVLLLLQKPMGQGTLSLCILCIFNILEIVDANALHASPIGPVALALLGSYSFFKTGHQAVLSSIQWETAFIPFTTVTYPWSPTLVILNTFAPQILCAIAVPAVVFWKVQPRKEGLLDSVAKALAVHFLVYAGIAVATVIEAAWLRRHLMLYRIFMPRMLMAVVVLVIVESVGTAIGLLGVRTSILSVGDCFGLGPLEPVAVAASAPVAPLGEDPVAAEEEPKVTEVEE